MKNYNILSLKILFFTLAFLKKVIKIIWSLISFFLAIINLKIVIRDFLSLIDLKTA